MRLASLTKNLALKLFSLVVAILLFLLVSIERTTPVDVEFRLEYQLSDNITLTGAHPTKIQATLQGPWANLRSFAPKDLNPVVIDLAKVGEPGTVRHHIPTSAVHPPAGMKVVALRPSQLEVSLDLKVERRVPVQPRITGRPAFGFEIRDVTATPARVRVMGPRGEMQTVDFVHTRPVELEGREESVELEVELDPPQSPLRTKEKKIKVRVEIAEEPVTRTFEDLPVEIENGPQGTRIEPERVAITIKGSRRIVDKLEKRALSVFVDVADEAKEGQSRFEKTVRLRGLPDAAQWVGLAPRVQVQLPTSRRGRTPRR